ncbi:MAG: hypothetical protein NVS4B8_02230 [Herpetosiphon sp.]
MGSTCRGIAQIATMTLYRKRSSLIAFAAGSFLFHLIVVVSFPAIGGADAVQQVVSTFPVGLRRLLKIAPNLQAGFGLRDYLALSFYHPVFLGLGSAVVVGHAADGLAGEIERGSVYLLLSRPILRRALVLGKAVEVVVGAGAVALAGWAGLSVGLEAGGLPIQVGAGQYFAVALEAWALFATLGAITLLVSSFGRSVGRVAGIGTTVALGSFVLDIVPWFGEGILALLNPWHHFDPPTIAASGMVGGGDLLVPALWFVAATAAAVVVFERRDLV